MLSTEPEQATDAQSWKPSRAPKLGDRVIFTSTSGRERPATVVAVWGNTPGCAANLQVLVDGNNDVAYWKDGEQLADLDLCRGAATGLAWVTSVSEQPQGKRGFRFCD